MNGPRPLRKSRSSRRKLRTEGDSRTPAPRWQLPIEHAIDGVAVHQVIRSGGKMVDFRYLEWNPAAERILGLARHDVLGRTGRELFPTIDERGLLARYARVMETGVSDWIEEYPTTCRHPQKVLNISCFRLDPDRFVTLFRDVSDRKLAEERLRSCNVEVAQANAMLQKVNAELERRNRELEDFTRAASHDLQEPLRKVVSFGDLLARALGDKLDAKAGQYLSLMQDATRRLQALIRDLLLMSRAERAPLRLELTPLGACIRAALEQLAAGIRETGAVVHVQPLPVLKIDADRICRLYQNLVSNALKFRRQDVTPEIWITSESGEEGFILGVADNGIGIEPQYREKIFDAFQRLHPRERYDGSGIGLAVCKRIVTRHGGRIWVQTFEGGGSHFKFVLQPG